MSDFIFSKLLNNTCITHAHMYDHSSIVAKQVLKCVLDVPLHWSIVTYVEIDVHTVHKTHVDCLRRL